VAEGRLLARQGVPGLDVLCGEARSPCYEAVHQRRVLFVADEYWIVEDRLRGQRPHQYDLRFHLSAAAEDATTLSVDSQYATLRAPGLALVVWSAGQARLASGWVSPLYGHKQPAPVVSVRVEDAVETTLVSLIVPLDDERRTPRMRVGENAVEVFGAGSTDDQRDVVTWSDSSAAWVRYDASGRRLRQAICV